MGGPDEKIGKGWYESLERMVRDWQEDPNALNLLLLGEVRKYGVAAVLVAVPEGYRDRFLKYLGDLLAVKGTPPGWWGPLETDLRRELEDYLTRK